MPTPSDNKCPTCKQDLKWSIVIAEGKKQYATECKCGKKSRKTWLPIPKEEKKEGTIVNLNDSGNS